MGFRTRVAVVGLFLMLVLAIGVVSFEQYTGGAPAPKDCAVHGSPMPVTQDLPGPVAEYPGHLDQWRGTVNDASCLNRTPVYGVVRPRSEQDARQAVAFARAEGLSVAVSGTRHSMGGQASFPHALVLDMRGMDAVAVHPSRRTARVQAGATWRQVLEAVHPHRLSVAAMPSIDVLSVGGTLSANAHGADFRTGSLASTVRSLRVLLADGTVATVDRTHRPRLFRAVIGGYGLFGVILEAELDLVPGEMYAARQRVMDIGKFPRYYATELVPDDSYRMMYAHLSTSPSSFLREAIVYTHRRTVLPGDAVPPLRQGQDSRVARLVLNLARHGGLGQRVKWAAQRHVLPRFRSCHQSRNEALRDGEACLVSRNQAMYNDLGLLRHKLDRYTDVLQEYFLPRDELVPFLDEARDALRAHDAVLLNASVRSVHEGETLLSYAKGERFSVVLYLSQDVSAAGSRDMASLTKALVSRALRHGGTFYLPYQQHYTRADLEAAYPEIDEFFAFKRAQDPGLLFMNSLYSRYADPAGPDLSPARPAASPAHVPAPGSRAPR